MMDIDNRLVGRTIETAEVDEYGVRIYFRDGSTRVLHRTDMQMVGKRGRVMDREEAREFLLSYSRFISEETDLWEALDLAIEALSEPKTIIGIDIPYGSDKGVATIFKGKGEKLILEGVKEIMSNAESATTTDCISRKQAIDALCEECIHGGYDTCSVDCTEVAVLHNLPPVTPPKKIVAQINIDTEELVERIKEEYEITDKVGEWIEHKYAEEYDGLIQSNFECSKCHDWLREQTNFCPNCGAKMKGEDDETD